ncbi:MAG: M48 family metallopeptidase, partial [Thermodesulfobacteriota bacterium]
MGPWTSIILAAFLAILAFGYLLDYLNIRHQARSPGSIPGEFAPYVDVDVLARAEGYAAENARFGAVASIYDNAILVGFVFGGGLVLYDRWIASLGLGFAAGGVVFFLLLLLGRAVLFVPFGLYRVFVIERRHGFCSMTPGLWVSDFLKSTAISMVLASAAAYGGLLIVQASPTLWWLWLWAFFLAASLLVMYISPRVIEPLFNRFTPVDDPALVEAASDLMARAGIRVAKVFKMDASRRTGHTNAYFAGLGRTKRIVLYDTILEKLDREEVLSVLAHEAGHWTGRHLVKRLAVMEAVSFAALYAAFRLVG